MVNWKMFKQSAQNLAALTRPVVKEWLDQFEVILTDCDGVLWMYNNAISGSADVINKFKENGKKVFFVTNNSTKTREEFLSKAHKMSFNVDYGDIVSTAFAAANYLKHIDFKAKVFVVGSSGITQELDAVGIRHIGLGPDILTTPISDLVDNFNPDPEVGAVVVGFDEHFSFPKLFKASSYLGNSDILFIATNTDERFPMPHCVMPGTGSIVNSVITASDRKPILMGKPNPNICEGLVKELGVPREKILMIGDRCNTDILLGKNIGAQTLLVGTGIHNMTDIERWKENGTDKEKLQIPDAYVERLGDLLQFM